MLEAKAKDQGHKRKCSPKKKKKKGLHKNFSGDLQKNWPIFEDLRSRGQGQGLDLRGQGQGLQNVSSRTPPLQLTADYLYSHNT